MENDLAIAVTTMIFEVVGDSLPEESGVRRGQTYGQESSVA